VAADPRGPPRGRSIRAPAALRLWGLQGNFNPHRGPLTRDALDTQGPAQRLRAVLEVAEALTGSGSCSRIEAPAIVVDLQRRGVVSPKQTDPARGGFGVAMDVGERFTRQLQDVACPGSEKGGDL